MPEKAYTGSGDDLLGGAQRIQVHKSLKAEKANGAKRLRDGRPKLEQQHIYTAEALLPSRIFPVSEESGKRQQIKANKNISNGLPVKRSVHSTEGPPPHQRKLQHDAQINNSWDFQALREEAQTLKRTRQTLPIWAKRSDIRVALRRCDILLLNGETGSGKSTQVPQFLSTEPWCRQQKVKIKTKDGTTQEALIGGVIAITQPRRVAAITLAHRVAREMGSPIMKGSSGKVGYSVRFDNFSPHGMKIKYVTEGTLLQEMLHDPNLRKYSAVIVDEIHERSVDVDLVAGFLRQLLHGNKNGRGGVPLKVVVMSATLDLGGIEAFFAKSTWIPSYEPGKNYGRTFLPHLLKLERDTMTLDESTGTSNHSPTTWQGFRDFHADKQHDPSKLCSNGPSLRSKPHLPDYHSPGSKFEEFDASSVESEDSGAAKSGVAVVYVQGRQYEVEIFYEANPCLDYLQNMLQTILQLHLKEPLPGDVLAFLTGQDEIEALQRELDHYSGQLAKGIPKMKVMPLHGSLHAQAQQDVFDKIKEPFTRKIVLATNIAETSVTVSGVRFVVDCGKSKVKQYRPRLGLESLLAKPISRVSAIQRAGRAGREAKGKCFRLYTEEDYLKLEQDELPEILRSDIVEAVLKMKARGVTDVLSFPLMDSPSVVAMEKALLRLHMMGALNDQGEITSAGKKMARFPLPAAYGRVLTAAADNQPDIVLELIDVISCLTTDADIFLQPRSEEEIEAIEEFRRDIQHREGDILTLLSTMQQYTAENTDRVEWCHKRMISGRAMKMAMQIRKQLRQICYVEKLVRELPPQDPQPVRPITPEISKALLMMFLKAFASNTALLAPDGTYITAQGKNTIAIHPSSTLYGQKFEAIMFLEHVFTAKSYAKRVSAIAADWIFESLSL